jgi:hypothetical protein
VPTTNSFNNSVKGIEEFQQTLKGLGLHSEIERTFKNHFDLYLQYKAVNGDKNAINKAFKTMAVNIDGVSKPHIDGLDFDDGMCLVLPFGNYEGGDVVFYELGYRIELRSGDAIFFKSKQLLHGNTSLKNALDQQFSLTFFTKKRDFHVEEPDLTI